MVLWWFKRYSGSRLFSFEVCTWVRASPRVSGIEAVRKRSEIARINTKMFLQRRHNYDIDIIWAWYIYINEPLYKNPFHRGVRISAWHAKANITREFPTTENVTILNSWFIYSILKQFSFLKGFNCTSMTPIIHWIIIIWIFIFHSNVIKKYLVCRQIVRKTNRTDCFFALISLGQTVRSALIRGGQIVRID